MSEADVQVQDGLLTINRLDEGARVCVALDGELDLSNVPTLEAALAEAIDSGKNVLIDLGKLEFLDSTGLSLIVRTLGRPDAERFSFLPSRSSAVRRLLSMTGLDQRMVISQPLEARPTLPAV
jgi:anti-sigma B factor antagonist